MTDDTYIHKGLRKQLIETLRAKGGLDEKVLSAMGVIPRHLFIEDTTFLKAAYEDKPFPIGAGQTISQPFTVAFQSSLLNVSPGEKVLEIGTGSGYQTAVLIELGAKVSSIERQRSLFDVTRARLKSMGYRMELRYGDGYKGLPVFAPFDKILVTCGAPEIPEALKAQLKVGGSMVVPVGPLDQQVMHLITRESDGTYSVDMHGKFKFVPMLSDKARSSR